MSGFNVMLAKDYNPLRVKSWGTTYIEPKLNGVRVIAVAKFANGVSKIKYYSRNGRELDMFSHLTDGIHRDAKRLVRTWSDSVVFDGEMMGKDFGDVAGAIHRKNATVESTVFHPFIAIPYTAFIDGIDWRSQKYRLAQMHDAGLIVPAAHKVANAADIKTRYNALRNADFEGGMVKDYLMPWIGKRTFAWMKLKEELTADLKVVAFKEGRGKYAGTLGALIVKYKKALVPVSGMTDALRDEIWNDQDGWMGKTVEVEYQEETVHGSLRHPRFVKVRDDK